MEYYSVIKGNEVLVCVTTCVNLENAMPSERNQTQNTPYRMMVFDEKSVTGKSAETESRFVVVRGWGSRE